MAEIKLPDDTLEKLRIAKAAIVDAKQFFNKAEAAGFNVAENRRVLNEQETKINRVKQGFFPNESI